MFVYIIDNARLKRIEVLQTLCKFNSDLVIDKNYSIEFVCSFHHTGECFTLLPRIII